MACGRFEAKGNVGNAKRGGDARQLGFDAANRFNRRDCIAAQVVVARRKREGKRIKNKITGFQAVAIYGEVVNAVSNPQFPFDVASLTFFIDEKTDHRSAVFGRELHYSVKATAFGIAVFEIGGVEDGASTEPRKSCLQNLRFGRIKHERNTGLGCEQFRQLIHVVGSIAPDVVDTDIENVCTLAYLILGHLNASIEIRIEECIAELLRTVGVRALANDHERGVLFKRNERIDRCCSGLVHGLTWGRSEIAAAFNNSGEMLGRCSAAAANDVHAKFGDESFMVVGQTFGGEVVVHMSVDNTGQTSIWNA